MSGALPSLEAQAARWRVLNESEAKVDLLRLVSGACALARSLGLRVEVREVSYACSMGATHEEITVTPSREGYQSTN